MRRTTAAVYVSPADSGVLSLSVRSERNGEVQEGEFAGKQGEVYSIHEGCPDLTYPRCLPEKDEHARQFYDGRVQAYDQNLPLTFYVHNEDETKVRNAFVDALDLRPHSRVLEIACGTGRDSEIIAARLDKEGELFLQDISAGMLQSCRRRLAGAAVPTEFLIANACYLPFPDRYFDAVFSFGGIGEFSDIRRSLAEMVRVTKVGGKVVFGDESMPPWLRQTEFSRILTTTNPMFQAPLPLGEMPVEARDVHLRWVIGGVFYLIDFRVGEGEPKGNFDFEIPGPRGGTLRTRYVGQLEGVTPEVKEMAQKAVAKTGKSMHKWLDEVVRAAAQRDVQLP